MRQRVVRAALGVAVAASFLVTVGDPAAAATPRYVALTGSDSGNDCANSAIPCRTIAWALAMSTPGDTINVAAGTYNERLVITKGVTIQGADAFSTFINGFSTPTSGAPVMLVNLATGQPTLTVNDVTLTQGYSTIGGGLSIYSGTVVLNDSRVVGNHASGTVGGGGIGVLGGLLGTTQHLTLNRAVVSSNTATGGNGGGIWSAGPVVANDTIFSNNQAVSTGGSTGIGGAVYLGPLVAADEPSLSLNGSSMSTNTATVGGAIASNLGTVVTVNSSLIGANTAVYGGAISNSGTATVSGTRLILNTSQFQGGAIWNGSFAGAVGPTLTLENTEIRGNTAAALGGGVVAITGSTTTVNGGSLLDNGSPNAGGLYLQHGATATITGTTLAGNDATAGNGGAIWASGDLTVAGSTFTENKASVVGGNNQTGTGGALYVGRTATSDTPSTTVTGETTFTDNDAWLGGAIGVNSGATLQVDGGTVLEGNSATNAGGGLYNAGDSTLDGTRFDGNHAPVAGGAVFNGSVLSTDLPTLSAPGIVAQGNDGGLLGGAIAVGPRASLLSTGATLQGNTAVAGGALYVQEAGMAHLSEAEIVDNVADGGFGGAAYNSGSLTVDHSLVAGNQAVPSAGNPTGTGHGGAFYSTTAQAEAVVSTRIDASTLTANHAGAGSAVVSTRPVVLTRSTVHGNSTSPGAGAIVTTGPLTVAESTVTGNTAASLSAGVYGYGGAGVAGSILAGNSGGNCPLPVADGGFNLSDDATCGFAGVADPVLGPLDDNGGATPTRMPGATSPAINQIPVGTATTLSDVISGAAVVLCAPGVQDQRGVVRPLGGQCDIGSVEVGNEAPTILGPDTATFVTGTAGSVAFESTGVPAPDLALSGPLPAGVSFVDNGDGTATLSGTPAAGTGGTYPVTITATNGTTPDATKAFTLFVHQPPAVTGPAEATFIVGQPGSVGFGSTGVPTPGFSADGELPAGVTFVDNGDGTATLAGSPAAGTEGSYPLLLTADNGVDPPALVPFQLTVVPALSVVTTALPAGQVGVPYATAVAAASGQAPLSWTVSAGALPAGLTLHADGMITGTPTGPSGTATFTVTVTDSGDPQQSASRELSITIGAGPTTLDAEPVVLSTSGTLIKLTVGRVSATLTGGDPRQPVAGRVVVFRAGGTTVCTGVTNAAGRATCTMSVANTLTVVLNGGVTANFVGDASWQPAADSAGLL